MGKIIKENPGYVPLLEAMSQANYVFKHNPIDESESWDFIYLRINKINLEAKDPRLQKFYVFLKKQEAHEEKFDKKYLKILIAILYDISKDQYKSNIEEVAYFHESNIDADEKDIFVSILLFEIKASKKSLLSDLTNLLLSRQKSVEESVVETQKSIDREIEIDEYLTTTERIRKKNSSNKAVFILHKKEKEEKTKKRPSKRIFSSRQKILSVLMKQKSFLIYQEAFPLPNGIKRIKITDSFEKILKFIKEYTVQTNLSVSIIIEDDRAKVLFKEKTLKKKVRKKIRICA